jgi:hypothetical protein
MTGRHTNWGSSSYRSVVRVIKTVEQLSGRIGLQSIQQITGGGVNGRLRLGLSREKYRTQGAQYLNQGSSDFGAGNIFTRTATRDGRIGSFVSAQNVLKSDNEVADK